jgi:acetylglutamate kinase
VVSARAVVLKLGGRALEAPGAIEALGHGAASLGEPLVLVHGGGAEVSAWSARLGLEPRFAHGLRVTDRATLEVAVAVLAGLANTRLVAALRAAGVDAVGLTALDGGIATVVPHADAARLGEVGRVAAVTPALIESLLAAGRVPVLASIGASGARLLNVNADDLAAAVAGALGARALVLLSDTPGVRIGRAVVGHVTPDALGALLAHPEVTGGMQPKLAAARAALEAGVPEVRITAWAGSFEALLAPDGPGTRFVASARPAEEIAHG